MWYRLLPALLLLPVALEAQVIRWQQTIGGDGADRLRAIAPTRDGGFVAVGQTNSGYIRGTGRGTETARYDADGLVVKINAEGEQIWAKTFGGDFTEELRDVSPTTDGGFIITGTTDSKSMTNGERDVYLLRLDLLGNPIWATHFGGEGNDAGNAVRQLTGGGFLVVGESGSLHGDATDSYGGVDAWALRVSETGELLWQHNFGGSSNDRFNALAETEDGRVMALGTTDSDNRQAAASHGRTDVLAAMLDTATGQPDWIRLYGGSENDEAYDLVKSPGGLLHFIGTTFSTDGDVQGNHGLGDIWVVCLDDTGGIRRSRSFGGSRNDGGNGLGLTAKGHLLLAGTTSSKDGDATGDYAGKYDAWVLKLDSTGKVFWQRSMGGTEKDEFFSVSETVNGHVLAAGNSLSNDRDLMALEHFGKSDFYLAALADSGSSDQIQTRPPTMLVGYVHEDDSAAKPVGAILSARVPGEDDAHSQTQAHPRYGVYDLPLPESFRLNLSVMARGYLFQSEWLELDADDFHTELRKDFQLTPIRVGSKINLSNIEFPPGEYELNTSNANRVELDQIRRFLDLNPRVKVAIHGHTDSTGEAETKQKLSLLRARQIRLFLIDQGIDAGRLRAKGFGMSRPLGPENSAAGRQRNRRVELYILDY